MRGRRDLAGPLATLPAVMVLAAPAIGWAGDAMSGQVVYTADVMSASRSGRRVQALDNLDLIGDLDLGAVTSWRGAQLHLYGLVNSGAKPNEALGTLEGVDNIEVGRARTRLFEAWLQQSFAGDRGSLRVGLYDLNSEFYATASSDQLINPAFGIGTELSATGSNGPSIFPSSALTVRLRWEDEAKRYIQVAVIDAKAGAPGDPGGVDLRFREGVLGVAEAGVGGATRWAVGAWGYTGAKEEEAPVGTPQARGAYVLVEHGFAPSSSGRRTTAFLRAGRSGGDAPVSDALQAGATITRPWSARPDGQLAFGVHYAQTAGGQSEGRRVERGLELSYVDKLTPRLTIQPDLQYIVSPRAGPGVDDILVLTLRLTVQMR